jgi:mannose-6-phosphate isomerase-like protein (cupin superfamily)
MATGGVRRSLRSPSTKELEMPKVSKESAANQEDHGPVVDRWEDHDGYRIQFVTFKQAMDGTELVKGCVDDKCQCPHWGYVLKGRITYRFADHEETHEAGDAFYVGPGHIPINDADTEYLQFSPQEELQVTSDQIMKNFQAMQAAS